MAARKQALTSFLKRLCTDKQFRARFLKAPEATMKAAGLTRAQREVVKSKDPERLKEAVVAEHLEPGATTAIVIIFGIAEFTV